MIVFLVSSLTVFSSNRNMQKIAREGEAEVIAGVDKELLSDCFGRLPHEDLEHRVTNGDVVVLVVGGH